MKLVDRNCLYRSSENWLTLQKDEISYLKYAQRAKGDQENDVGTKWEY